MTDPRIAKLSDILAELIVAVVDIANAGAPPQVAATAQLAEPNDPAPKATRAAKGAKPAVDEPRRSASEPWRSANTSRSSIPPETVAEDTLDDAKAFTIKLVQAKGRPVAVELLESFKAVDAAGKPSALALTADQLGPFCDAARELLAA